MKTVRTLLSTVVLFHLLTTCALSQARQKTIVVNHVSTYGCITGNRPSSSRTLSNSTGRSDVDNGVSAVIGQLNQLFGVYVPVYFEISDVKNAFFTKDKYPDLIMADTGTTDQPFDGSVILTFTLWNDEVVKNAGFAIPAILAHEFAHAMQSKNQFPYSGKWLELHADFMAGWYTGHRGRTNLQDEKAMLKSFYDKGDGEFFSEGHHGTSEERAAAFLAGYAVNRGGNVASGSLAYASGIDYLKNCQRLGLCLSL